MTFPLPTLDLPATGTLDQGEVTVSRLGTEMSLSISNTADLPSNGKIYAFILSDKTDDPESPSWSGQKTNESETGDWYVPPGEDPEDGDFRRRINIQVKIPKSELQKHTGKKIYVGYTALANESGMTESSGTIELTVK
jgi:hypothetical protein